MLPRHRDGSGGERSKVGENRVANEGDPHKGDIVADATRAMKKGGESQPADIGEKVGNIVAEEAGAAVGTDGGLDYGQLREIYNAVVAAGAHNYRGARVRVPSGLSVEAWKRNLQGYHDRNLVEFLEFGWPTNCDRGTGFVPVYENHPSATSFPEDINFHIATERRHAAVAGPFSEPPFRPMHCSPLMTRPKKDARHRRVIMDLSWPPGASINDAIETACYVDGLAEIRLPTVDYMEGRLRTLGPGAYLYKTDLARGYRQLRVDPGDWPLLGFTHNGEYFFDICPSFGLRTSALCMQRTSEAICWIHQNRGFISRPYLDDFGGAEATKS